MSDDEWWKDLPIAEEEKCPEELWILENPIPAKVNLHQLPQMLCHYFLQIEPFFSDSDLYEPADWEWRKYIVRSAARWRCQDCDANCKNDLKNFHTDHVNGREPNEENEFRPHAFGNLRARCLACHETKHGYQIRDRRPTNVNPFE